MAWGSNTQVDAKEIIGMSSDELKTNLGKIDSVESKINDFSAKTSEMFKTLTDKMDALTPKPKETPDPTLDFLTDPEESINKRMAPFEKQTLDNTIALQHSAARATYAKDFDRWGKEIVDGMGELSAQQQADPRVWGAMVLMIRGKHAGDIEKDGATGKFAYLEPVSAGLRPDPSKADGLSPAQRLMVEKFKPFGMTAEKYAKGQERLASARTSRMGSFAGVEN